MKTQEKLIDGKYVVDTFFDNLMQKLLNITMVHLYRWCPDVDSTSDLVSVMFPLVFDVSTEYLADMVCRAHSNFKF